MTVTLSETKVNRSAHAVKTAEATTVYLGHCDRHDLPVREAKLGLEPELAPRASRVLCFHDPTDEHEILGEKLVSVTTSLDCDASCKSARRNACSCGCGGANHGLGWSRQYKIDHRELFESQVEAYRAEQVRLANQREAKREAAVRAANSATDTWCADHAELVAALGPWFEHRTDDVWQPRHWGSHILVDFAIQVVAGWNGKRKPLSEKQVQLAHRILGEIAAQQRKDAEREAARAAKPGAGDQSRLVPGVYQFRGDVFVVKGNRDYLAWRKDCKTGAKPRPGNARLYAKRLMESAPRVTEAGTEIPFELVYAPGVIRDLALSDRMPLADAEALSTRYAACIVCGRHLKAAKSVRAAIGPVCSGYFGPVLAA